jgi:hypothetical protein
MRRFLLFVVIVISVSPSWADFQPGISGGVNIGDIKTDWENLEEPDIFPRFGYSIGIGTELELNENLSFLIDLSLVSKNYAYAPDYYGAGIKGFDRYSLLYIDLPVRVSYNHRNMRVFAGPFIDYCISGTNKYNLVYSDSSVLEGSVNIKSGKQFSSKEIRNNRLAVNYLDGGLIFGMGYRNENYCLDLSYSLGLLNIYPKIQGGQDRSKNISKTRMLVLTLFFYL